MLYNKVMTKRKSLTLTHLKNDLHKLNLDWDNLLSDRKLCKDPTFLKKFSKDIKKIYNDAVKAEKNPNFKKRANLIVYLITSPFGAPFVEETTLLEAVEDPAQLSRLLTKISKYGHKYPNQLFQVFEDLEEELSA